MNDGRTILVAGTASHVGKSTVSAGLCRILDDRGIDVAPFKAQNMSNNARAVTRPAAVQNGDGSNGSTTDRFGEIGVSQYVQARAARITPTTDHNPVLLKPRGDGQSQLVLDGVAVDHFDSTEYYETAWEEARETAIAAHRRLEAEHDVVVAEGAGSIAEINLQDRDLANVETARFADAEIVLVADIERGGVFASIVGTLELLPDDLREQVVGVVITKFRGDPGILEEGLEQLEERTGVPVIDVLPYDDPGLPEEDSLALPAVDASETWGADDGYDGAELTIAVPRLPRASNVTDVEPLAAAAGVAVSFRPLSADIDDAHAVVLTGTKNTVDDLRAVREAGLDDRLREFSGPIVGLCGGYQLLGERIHDADIESTTDIESIEGVGLLPVETRFSREKTVRPVERRIDCAFLDVSGPVRGYEIHMGQTRRLESVDRPFPDDGAVVGSVLGTYLHDLFGNRIVREAFLDTVAEAAGIDRPADETRSSPYDEAATLVEDIASVLF
ncbi:MAG: cobyric acid synthase [Natronomonas sp.]